MDPEAMLTEIDEIDRLIASSQSFLASLSKRHEAIEVALDAVTRPASHADSTCRTALTDRGYCFRGQHFSASKKIGVYLGIVRAIWRDFPNLRDVIATEVKRASYSRSYFAKDRVGLFDGWPAWKARKHSVELMDGWFADTNLSQEQMERVLKIGVCQAGLRWGTDVSVHW